MAPAKKKRGRKGSTTRGRPHAKPKQGPPEDPIEPSKWPHLEKQAQQSLDAQAGCAFLSLQIPTLKSHATDKGWELLSRRASLFSPQQAAEEAARSAKQRHEQAEQQAELQERQRKQKLEQRRLAAQNVAFLTLKFSDGAWKKSQIPLAQSWRASQATVENPGPDQNTQSKDTKPAEQQHEQSLLISSSLSNELDSENRRVSRNNSNWKSIATRNPGLAHPDTPDAPEFSPITPTVPFAQQCPLRASRTDLTDLGSDISYSELDHPYPEDPYTMSGKPSVDTGGVDDSIKDVIQNLFVMQQHVASFRPEIQDGLHRKVEDLAVSLQNLDDLVANPSNPIHNIKIAPDIIDYVDDGRNPDIYTRDFVELVQRGNSVMNGKQQAFRNFSKIFAKALKDNFDGMDEEVDLIMENAGMEEKNGRFVEKQQNGSAA